MKLLARSKRGGQLLPLYGKSLLAQKRIALTRFQLRQTVLKRGRVTLALHRLLPSRLNHSTRRINLPLRRLKLRLSLTKRGRGYRKFILQPQLLLSKRDLLKLQPVNLRLRLEDFLIVPLSPLPILVDSLNIDANNLARPRILPIRLGRLFGKHRYPFFPCMNPRMDFPGS